MAALPTREAAAAGFDPGRLEEACAWAARHDSGVATIPSTLSLQLSKPLSSIRR